ncbi:ras-related protein Rab5-like [Coffea arabica]|uniref:Ras-related protein Rab5-like n=1 Tax=Coffea arabica TaxID=13443 RepID=A0ABM4W9F0_COFAR
MALAGNKADLEDKRQVTTEDAKLFADQNGLIFMETSAKVETNIKELFFKIATTLAAQPVHAECVINLGDPCPAAEPSKSLSNDHHHSKQAINRRTTDSTIH